jgi:alpha/beta superfamily hydrolase
MLAADDPRPKLLLVPEHDQYCDPAGASLLVDGWTATTVQVVPGADHFLAGRLSFVLDAVAATLTA